MAAFCQFVRHETVPLSGDMEMLFGLRSGWRSDGLLNGCERSFERRHGTRTRTFSKIARTPSDHASCKTDR